MYWTVIRAVHLPIHPLSTNPPTSSSVLRVYPIFILIYPSPYSSVYSLLWTSVLSPIYVQSTCDMCFYFVAVKFSAPAVYIYTVQLATSIQQQDTCNVIPTSFLEKQECGDTELKGLFTNDAQSITRVLCIRFTFFSNSKQLMWAYLL